MIKNITTFFTLYTVSTPIRFNNLALKAELLSVMSEHQLQELLIRLIFIYEEPRVHSVKDNSKHNIQQMETKLHQ